MTEREGEPRDHRDPPSLNAAPWRGHGAMDTITKKGQVVKATKTGSVKSDPDTFTTRVSGMGWSTLTVSPGNPTATFTTEVPADELAIAARAAAAMNANRGPEDGDPFTDVHLLQA